MNDTPVGAAWLLGVTIAVPISADRYQAPPWVKYVVTCGHIAAITIMSLPYRGKPRAVTIIATLASAWALLQVCVLWYWN